MDAKQLEKMMGCCSRRVRESRGVHEKDEWPTGSHHQAGKAVDLR